MPRSDLVGQKYGMLTVLRAGDVPGYWVCQCDCGNISKPLLGYSLRSGNTKSCGCLRRGPKDTLADKEIDENGRVYDNSLEPKRSSALTMTPRRTESVRRLLRDNPEALPVIAAMLESQGIKLCAVRGKPVYYNVQNRWFGPFKTPIEAIGHLWCYAYGEDRDNNLANLKMNSPYARYRGLRDLPKEAL